MCRTNNWTFAVIASKTLWALNVLVAGRSLSFTLVTMGNAFFALSTATDIRQSTTGHNLSLASLPLQTTNELLLLQTASLSNAQSCLGTSDWRRSENVSYLPRLFQNNTEWWPQGRSGSLFTSLCFPGRSLSSGSSGLLPAPIPCWSLQCDKCKEHYLGTLHRYISVIVRNAGKIRCILAAILWNWIRIHNPNR